MDFDLLEQMLASAGEPAFRKRQIWRWTAQGAEGFWQMTDLPVDLRERLERSVAFSCLSVEKHQRAIDGTEKVLFATQDGRPLEAVLMRYADGRQSVCLSSQSGCPLTCRFCATGSMRFGRNLTASEIIDQALFFRRRAQINHAVFMGMGEPLMNTDAVLAASAALQDMGIAKTNVAVSTVGWLPGIEHLIARSARVRLALSVHAADESLRSELMPVNMRYPLSKVLEACRAYARAANQRVFVEYLMLDGINDRYEQALELADLLRPHRSFKVNLIPHNPTAGRFSASSDKAIAAFARTLKSCGLTTTIRLTRGREIDAACGQLAAARSAATA